MNLLITGATGLIGSAVASHLLAAGHRVIPLSRGARAPNRPTWDPAAGEIDLAPAGPLDAVIHLAGENIAAGRWTAARKARILTSRAAGTHILARTLANLAPRPAVLIAASAIGFYGDRADESLDEHSPAGSGFLPDVCRAWEDATAPAAQAGIRVVNARLGMVLARNGGALAKMLPLFRLGLGGPIGDGRQWMSWITREDLVAAFTHILSNPSLRGPVNCVAPTPVTNADFTRVLGRALHRPAILRAPAFALRLLLGEMADELLLASARVRPVVLDASGFTFAHPTLEPALRELIP